MIAQAAAQFVSPPAAAQFVSPPATAQFASPPATECPCGHPDAQHDRVAVRYCAATTAKHLGRSCICQAAPADVTPSPATG
jgi:hypothetical protein